MLCYANSTMIQNAERSSYLTDAMTIIWMITCHMLLSAVYQLNQPTTVWRPVASPQSLFLLGTYLMSLEM